VTIFGQSAGAGSVKSLVTSPLSMDLVAKAIIMSGGGLGSGGRPGMLLDTAQLANKRMMDYFEKTTLEEMRTLSFEDMRQMAADYAVETKERVMWWPVIDGYVSMDTFTNDALSGRISDIPYMIGFTANDMSDMVKDVADFCALRAEQSSKPAYAYLFTRQLPGDDNGAWHSSDLWYVFHAFRHSWRPFTPGDEALSLKMVDYYTNFAKSGDPNGKGGGEWTPNTPDVPKFMLLDADEEKAICTMTDSPKFLGGSPRK
jgi:para-nitrobenzyl esterase